MRLCKLPFRMYFFCEQNHHCAGYTPNPRSPNYAVMIYNSYSGQDPQFSCRPTPDKLLSVFVRGEERYLERDISTSRVAGLICISSVRSSTKQMRSNPRLHDHILKEETSSLQKRDAWKPDFEWKWESRWFFSREQDVVLGFASIQMDDSHAREASQLRVRCQGAC